MAEKEVNPMIKSALELGPVFAFVAVYLLTRDKTYMVAGTEYEGFILVTAAFIPLIIVTTLILWKLTGQLSKMQIVTVILVTVMGGLTVWLNDDRFFKMKPTLIYLLFGGILGVGLLQGKSYLRSVMDGMVPLQHEGWMILTRRFTAFFFGLAALNEIIWRTQSTDIWVYFKSFGLPVAIFAFFMTQASLFRTYSTEDDDKA